MPEPTPYWIPSSPNYEFPYSPRHDMAAVLEELRLWVLAGLEPNQHLRCGLECVVEEELRMDR